MVRRGLYHPDPRFGICVMGDRASGKAEFTGGRTQVMRISTFPFPCCDGKERDCVEAATKMAEALSLLLFASGNRQLH